MSLVKSSDSAHWYRKSGESAHDSDLRVARKELLYPSVTTVDKEVFKNDFLDKWLRDQILIAAGDNPRMPHENGKQYAQRIYDLSMEKSRNAMAFGIRVHDASEHYPNPPADQDLMPWFNSIGKWWNEAGVEPIAREITVLDHEIGVAGRLDLKALVNGKRSIIDFKTQDVKVDDKGKKKPNFYDSWVRQLSFYGAADAKESGAWPLMPEVCNVIIDSNPEAGVYVKWWNKDEILSAHRTFTHGSWLWFDKRDYWPVGHWYPQSYLTERQVPIAT